MISKHPDLPMIVEWSNVDAAARPVRWKSEGALGGDLGERLVEQARGELPRRVRERVLEGLLQGGHAGGDVGLGGVEPGRVDRECASGGRVVGGGGAGAQGRAGQVAGGAGERVERLCPEKS